MNNSYYNLYFCIKSYFKNINLLEIFLCCFVGGLVIYKWVGKFLFILRNL